jgi:hypothetical protein
MAQYYNKSYSYDYSMSVHTNLTGEEPEEAIRPYYGANATYYRWGNLLVDMSYAWLDPRIRYR